METTAAVCYDSASNLKLETVELAEPRGTEVVVRVDATGMCQTDMMVRDGRMAFPTPSILGHEGAGVVVDTGPGVTAVEPGDRVVLTTASCGRCARCHLGHPALCAQRHELRWSGTRTDGSPVVTQDGLGIAARFLGQSTFAAHTLVEERTVVKIDDDVPATTLAPFGCSVVTGAGAILRVLRPEPGATVVVLGAGAVGLPAIMAAAMLPVSRIIAVDLMPGRLALAREVGATDTVDATAEPDLTGAILELTHGEGADAIVDTTGATAVIHQGLAALAPAGTLGLISSTDADTRLEVPIMPFLSGAQSLRAVVLGDSTAPFLRTLVRHCHDGRFPISRLIRTYPIHDIEEAAADNYNRDIIQPVLTFD